MNQPISPEFLAAQAQQRLLKRKRRVKAAARPKKQRLSPSQQRGHLYEQRAVDYLKLQGLTILLRNLDNPLGEIDIVARSRNDLVFVEVRYRRSNSHGGALYSVQHPKQQRLKRTALSFLPKITQHFFNGITPYCRFDVVAFEGDDIIWLRDAFR